MSEEQGDGAPVFVFLGGRSPKYFELTVQAIKFLKIKVPQASVGIITPPDTGDLVGAIEERLHAIDSKINTSEIRQLEGKKRLDNWNNTQYILDLRRYAEECDPIVFLDAGTCVLQNILPYVQEFKNSGKKFGFLKDTTHDYPDFNKRWEGGDAFIPLQAFMIFRAEALDEFAPIWENTWKEWITPAPFVKNNNDPAPYHRLSILDIYKYALAQALTRYVKNFDEEVSFIPRENLKICRNLAPETQKIVDKFYLTGAPYGKEEVSKVIVLVQSATIHDAEDVLGKGSPFVSVRVGDYVKETVPSNDSQAPVWDRELVFDNVSYADADRILFTLADVGLATNNDPAFTATLSLVSEVTFAAAGYSADAHPPARAHYTLSVKDGNGEERALLEVSAQFLVELQPEEE